MLGLDRPPGRPDGAGPDRPHRRGPRLLPPAPRPRPGHPGDPRRRAGRADRHRQQPRPTSEPASDRPRATSPPPCAPTGTPTAGGSTRCTAAASPPTCSSSTASTCPSAPGDLETIAAPLDWLGLNYYFPTVVADDPAGRPRTSAQVHRPGVRRTAMDWEVDADGPGAPAAAAHRRVRRPQALRHRERLRLPGRRPAGRHRRRPGAHRLPGGAPGRLRPRRPPGRPAGRLLRLVPAGQLRVGLRLRQALRSGPRRLHDAEAHDQGQRAPLRGDRPRAPRAGAQRGLTAGTTPGGAARPGAAPPACPDNGPDGWAPACPDRCRRTRKPLPPPAPSRRGPGADRVGRERVSGSARSASPILVFSEALRPDAGTASNGLRTDTVREGNVRAAAKGEGPRDARGTW